MMSFPDISISISSIFPSHGFGYKKLVQTHTSIESAPAAVLDTAMLEDRLIMYCHAVDVYGAVE